MLVLFILFVARIHFVIPQNDGRFLPDEHYFKKGSSTKCFGYEKQCDINESISKRIQCSKSEDVQTFFRETDFGYVKKRINTMQDMCIPRGESEIIHISKFSSS